MSCPQCPHCGQVSQKGDLSLISDLSQSKISESKLDPLLPETPKLGVRGKAREYSPAFEVAWRIYGRKEQKFEAYAMWSLRAKEVGGESNLVTLFCAAMKWQAPRFSTEGWQYAPYLERYLKRRKWEDEPPVAIRARAVARHDGTDRKLQELRAAAERAATPEEIQRARDESRKIVRELVSNLANQKGVR